MTAALVIDGHPNPDSLTAAIARSYAEAHGDARLLPLRELDFDPNLRFGYRKRIPIEPDLRDAREALHEARRIVIVTPMWWGSVPAILKGFFDRALLPGDEYVYPEASLPKGLLRGRSGRLFLLADTPRIARPILGVHATAQVSRHTMKFCGVRPFPVRRLLGVRYADERRIERWISDAARTGAADARRDARIPASRASAAVPAPTAPGHR